MAEIYFDIDSANVGLSLAGDLILRKNGVNETVLTGATAGDLRAANNLSDVANAATSLSNLAGAPLASPVFTGVPQVPAPTIGASPTTKTYVDGLASNVGKRQTVRVATTGNVTIATALNAGDTIDGIVLSANDIVLVYQQTAPAQNGIYVAGAVPARSTEFDTYNEHPGSLIIVQEGTVNAERMFLCTSNSGGTIDVTAITFSPTSVVGALLAANNLSDVATPATAVDNLGGATSVGTGGLARSSVAVTSSAYAGFTDVTAALDALNTADTLAIRDASASDIKEATLAILAGFWNLPVTPQMFGAKGDYVPTTNTGTNDAVALQAAIDHVTTNGGWLWLGKHAYRWDVSGGVGIVIGSATNTPVSPSFTISGSGSALDASGCSITVIGTATNAILVNDSVYRGMQLRGFSVRCKALLADNVFLEPTTEAGFTFTNGMCFDDLYFSRVQIDDFHITNTKRAIVFLGTNYNGNGENVKFSRVIATATTRFLFMAAGVGQSLQHTFVSCGFQVTHNYIDVSGFAAVEIGGGGGGFDAQFVDFNGTVTYDATSTAAKTIETLTRSTLVKDNGISNRVNFDGGRLEGLTTIVWKAAGTHAHSQIVLTNIDFGGLYCGTANPFMLAATDTQGYITLRNCASCNPVFSSDSRFDTAFIRFTLTNSKVNVVVQDMAIGGWNSVEAAQRRMVVVAGGQFTARLEFRNVLYYETSSAELGWYLDQVITGSIPNHGDVPSLAFA